MEFLGINYAIYQEKGVYWADVVFGSERARGLGPGRHQSDAERMAKFRILEWHAQRARKPTLISSSGAVLFQNQKSLELHGNQHLKSVANCIPSKAQQSLEPYWRSAKRRPIKKRINIINHPLYWEKTVVLSCYSISPAITASVWSLTHSLFLIEPTAIQRFRPKSQD